MTRLLTLGGAALAAVALTVVVVRAQEAAPPSEAEQAEQAERQAEAARKAEAAARQAEERAREAVEQARAMAEEARAVAEKAAAAAVADAERAAEISADMLIDADPFGQPGDSPFGGPPDDDDDPFADEVPIPGGLRRVQVFAKGPKWGPRAADPETMQMIELERKVSGQIAALVAKYKSLTDDEERSAMAKELSARVGDQFTVRQSLREKELVALEEQVERLRGLHDKRNEQKDRIIDDRVQQLLREAEGLGWGEGGGEGAGWGWGEAGAKYGDAAADFQFHLEGLPGQPAQVKFFGDAIPKAKRIIVRGAPGAIMPPDDAGEPVPVPVPVPMADPAPPVAPRR